MAIYAPAARELLPDLPLIIGKPAIRAFYARLMSRLPRFAHHFEPREVTVAEAGDRRRSRHLPLYTGDAAAGAGPAAFRPILTLVVAGSYT